MQTISAMLHYEEGIIGLVPVQPHYVAEACCVTHAVIVSLVLLICPELPDAASGIENGARLSAFGARRSVLLLAGVGIGTDVHIHIAAIIYYNGFGIMLIAIYQSGCDHFRCIWRCYMIVRVQLVTIYCSVGRGVE